MQGVALHNWRKIDSRRCFCNSRNFIYAVFVAILLFALFGLAGAAGMSPGRDVLRSMDGNVLPTAPLSAELQRSFRKRPSTKADDGGEAAKAARAAQAREKRRAMPDDEKAERNAKDAARKVDKRRGMADDAKAERNAQDAARMEKKRRGMADDEKAKHNAQDAARKKEERRGMADDEKAKHNAQDAARKKEERRRGACHPTILIPNCSSVRPSVRSSVTLSIRSRTSYESNVGTRVQFEEWYERQRIDYLKNNAPRISRLETSGNIAADQFKHPRWDKDEIQAGRHQTDCNTAVASCCFLLH